MKKRLRQYLMSLYALLLLSCSFEMGAGGSVHLPPEKIIAGETTEINIKCISVGAGSGKMSDRYTDLGRQGQAWSYTVIA